MPTQQPRNKIITARAATYWERLTDNDNVDERIVKHKEAISSVFGLSDFIAEQAISNPDWLPDIVSDKGKSLAEADFAELLRAELDHADSEESLHRILRRFRNKHMLAIAWQDVTNSQPIEQSLKQVSVLADALIIQAYHWLYASHCTQYGTPQGPHGPQPLLILAMGKLGGGELNFSSDIDMIFTYPVKGVTEGGKKAVENQQFFTRLAQKLIAALNKVTAHGQVFRVDMRLRPFGDSGPLAIHFAALEDYYQEQGRHWERFAMVKARVLNPASEYTRQLDSILRPFTFRRYLDFTTIDALRTMKQLISSEIRRRQLAQNIKLGAGGIREVEFFAQSFQLIHGGREPALQVKNLKATLHALAELSLVAQHEIEALYQDYLFLRKTEHTLQQCKDEQTQTLPEDEWQQQVIAAVMQFPSYAAFLEELEAVMARIHEQFNDLIEETHDSHDDDDSLYLRCKDAWAVGMNEDEFVTLLSADLQHTEAVAVYIKFNEFRTQLRSYRMGQRGEDTLQKLMPEVLYVLLDQHPARTDAVLGRVLGVINAITGRTTYLDLLLENPNVLQQLVKLCARSEWISDQIKRFPLLLDELLTPLYLQQQNTDIEQSRQQYQDELRQQLLRVDPDDTGLVMDVCRQFKLCQQLRIAASDISGSLPVSKVSDKLTVLAEVLLESVFFHAWEQVRQRFGVPDHLEEQDTGFSIVAYGKLGGYELGYGSDLDLVFLHNAPKTSQTNGNKSIGASQFYIKLAQRIMHLLNTTTLFGQLYETDLRLRPSGNAGLLCCHVDGFAHYQQDEAWTWEHQALVRARAVFGDSILITTFNNIRENVLRKQRDVSKLKQEVVEMRQKMRVHLLAKDDHGVDLKHCEGGITDIEFLTQYWVLAYASKCPQLTRFTDNLRVLDIAMREEIISAQDAEQLQSTYLQLRDNYHQLILADHKLADETAELEKIRGLVSTIWNRVFFT